MAEQPMDYPDNSGKYSSQTQWDSPDRQETRPNPQPRQWDRWQNEPQQERQQYDRRYLQQDDAQYGNQSAQYTYGGGQEPPRKNNTVLIVLLVILGAALLSAIAFIMFFVVKDRCSFSEEVSESRTEPPVILPTEPPTEPAVTNPPATDPPTPLPTPEPVSPVKKNGKSVYAAGDLFEFDVVTFGNYPQTGTGAEAPIEWYVVRIEGNKVMLLSRYCLDSLQFHQKNEEITFRNSDLYRWLNSEFKRDAFSDEERVMLAREITLPDRAEAFRLLPEAYRCTTGTEYAIAHGFDVKNNLWWLGEFYGTTYTYGEWNVAEHHCAYAMIADGSDAWYYQVDFHGKGVRPMIVIQF